jgi:putative phosphoesterase
MRVAALYDIHGNLPALEAVLAEVHAAGVDEVVVGGDVYPGPMCEEVMERLLSLELPVHFIRGNGDREVLELAGGRDPGSIPAAYREAIVWVAERLEPEHRRLMSSWPATLRLQFEGLGDVLFCHATPASDSEIFTRETPDERVAKLFADSDAALVVCGHTHMQFNLEVAGMRGVNAGSVGMPFGEPGAYWLLLGPSIELRRTNYDPEAAAARIRTSGYPQAEEFAEHNVLRPPSEKEMLALYERAELL